MRVLKFFLIIFSIVGLVLCCGCTSEGVSKPVESDGEVKTPTTSVGTPTTTTTTSQETQTQTITTTTKEETKAENENSQAEGLPAWAKQYLPPDAKNYTYYVWKVIKVEDDGITCKAEFIGSNDKNIDKRPGMVYTEQLLIYTRSPDKRDFNDFLKCNGVDLFKVLTNDTLKQKYEEKYKEYLKICNESLAWERKELEGKELVVLMCWLDCDKVKNISNYPNPGVYGAIYIIYDNGKDYEYEVLKRGYGFGNEEYLKQLYQNALTNNYTETANYFKKSIDAQEYAKEHKLGVWSIDLSDLKTK